jgi:hypothetical protein
VKKLQKRFPINNKSANCAFRKKGGWMFDIKKAFAILSIAIFLVPMAGLIILYRDNLEGIVLPPEVKNLASGDFSSQMFPTLTGETVDPTAGTVSFYFRFENVLSSKITVKDISSDIVDADDHRLIAHISLSKTLIIMPNKPVMITVSGTLTSGTIQYFKDYLAQSSENDDIHLLFQNLHVEAAGITAYSDSSDAGWLMVKGVV